MAIGNTKLHALLRRGSRLSSSAAWFDFFTVENRKKILDLIRYAQLKSKGINADGEIIGFYSYATELISGGEKQEGDPYTLDDTGEFYESMFIQVFIDSFVINADANKGEDNLFSKYGNNIIGLTEQNLDLIIIEIRKSYLNYAKKILLGT